MGKIDDAVKYACANSAIENMQPTKEELKEIKERLEKERKEKEKNVKTK